MALPEESASDDASSSDSESSSDAPASMKKGSKVNPLKRWAASKEEAKAMEQAEPKSKLPGT